MAGRPTLYTENTPELAEEYLKQCKDTVNRETKKMDVNLPSMEGLAAYIGVSRDTINEWSRVHPAFSDVLGKVKVEQGKRLINKGLSGEYSPVIAKLLLMSKHGMAEKTETDITSGGQSITAGAENVAAIVAEAERRLKEQKT